MVGLFRAENYKNVCLMMSTHGERKETNVASLKDLSGLCEPAQVLASELVEARPGL